jgi:RNA recognition motif-containing protein
MQREVIVAPLPPPPQLLKSGGFSNLATSQILRGVYVTNVSINATLKDISDFFSYCGNIEKVIQSKDPNNQNAQIAVVVMDQENDYATALLLSNAVIVDSPIQVYPYRDLISITMAAHKSSENFSERENRTAKQVASALINEGYITEPKVVDVLTSRAQRIDDATSISMQHRVNLALKFATGKQRTDNDQQLQETFNNVRDTATSFGSKVMESEAMKSTSDFFSRGWDFLKTSFNEATAPSPSEGALVSNRNPAQYGTAPKKPLPPAPQTQATPQKKQDNLLDFE